MRISDWSSDVCSSDLRDGAELVGGEMGDGGLHALGQQDGDAVSLFDALGLQHVGTAVGEALEIAKAVARLAAVGVEMDERQTIRVGPPVAGVDSDVVEIGRAHV